MGALITIRRGRRQTMRSDDSGLAVATVVPHRAIALGTITVALHLHLACEAGLRVMVFRSLFQKEAVRE